MKSFRSTFQTSPLCNFNRKKFLRYHDMQKQKKRQKNTPFFQRKVCQRTSHQTHYFILSEAFEIPKDFSRKVLCVGVWGRQPPTDNAHKKTRRRRVFYFFVNSWNCRSKPCFKVLLKKHLKNPQNFPTDYTTSF